MENQESQGHQGLLVPQGLGDCLVCQEKMENKERMENQEHQDRKDHKGREDCLGCLGYQESKDTEDFLVLMVPKVNKGRWEKKELRGQQDLWDLLDQWVQQDLEEKGDVKDLLDHLA